MASGGDDSGIRIRGYEEGDAAEIARLFHGTVHTVNRADYSPEQLRAWSPEIPDPEVWHGRMIGRRPLLAEEGGEDIAFAEMEGGHLDMLYRRKDAVGRNVGSRRYLEVEREASERGMERIYTEASIAARPFFERRGFSVLSRQVVVRCGVELTNFIMHKRLGG